MTFPSRYIASALVFYCESYVVVGGQSRARRAISTVIEGPSWLEYYGVDDVLESDVSKSLSDVIIQTAGVEAESNKSCRYSTSVLNG
jgi:hypothetical protein